MIDAIVSALTNGWSGGLSSGLAANAISEFFKGAFQPATLDSNAQESETPNLIEAQAPTKETQPEPKFQTLQALTDFEKILSMVKTPVVHFVIEETPSTAWHLPVVVMESSVTGEWYVFRKGNLAFEGVAGRSNAMSLTRSLVEKGISIGSWFTDQASSDLLSEGRVLWPELKPRCIPAMAHPKRGILLDFLSDTLEKTAG